MTVSAKSFDDTEGHWAEEAIDEWSDNGILNGIGNNKFNPDGLMTRAEAAAVFSRLFALNERTNISDFKDVDSDAWYAESLEKCVAAGILNGDGNNMNPNGYITREMFFTMFGRAFSIQPESALTKEFSDSDEISSWAQGYTYAFINQGYVNGVTENTVAPKNNIDRASVITLLDRLIANYAVQDNDVLQSTDKGISLVIANNCTVADGFSGTVVISGDDTKISFKGASVNTKIIVQADNAVIADVPEGVTVSVAKGAENVEVNGKQVEDDTTFTATVEKVEEKEDKKPVIVGGGGHSHRYTGSETTKATCTEDGVMTYTCRCGRSYPEAIPKLSENGEHTPAEPVKENETENTYDEVVYCSVCTVEISRTQKSNVSCTEHTPATTVKENEVAGTCKVEGTYDEVVYCSVCDDEISRTQKTSGYGEHIPAQAIRENEVAGTCLVEGTYDEVVYCSVCSTHEISRTPKTSGYGEHIPATAVKENELVGNCQTLTTYDEVVYCSVCGTHEVSRTQKTGALGDHIPPQ
ncbi:MAG: S-layer homology domain-containing protein [Clostridia bacterium]|nr:S-layer homology domain-containing protein [Clostridia bacterium]